MAVARLPVVGAAVPVSVEAIPADAAAPAAAAAVPEAKASDKASIHAEPTFIGLAYLLVGAGAILAWLLWKWFDPKGFKPAPDISAFAVLYVFAQSIERLLEPLTQWAGRANDSLDKQKAVTERDEAVAALPTAANDPEVDTGEALKTLATKQEQVDQVRANLAVLLWAVASLVAMLVCGAFGVLLLEGIGLDVPEWFDIAVTGLAIGSGTKPLHDLISNIQKAKENREDPAEVTQ
jgi:hypothetical protein